MAIGVITLAEQAKTQPVFVDRLSFAGDGAYPTGGTAAFQAKLRAKTGDQRQILAVIPQDCGGYHVVYDHAADKLKVYHGNNDGGADGPAVEVPNATDLSAVTFNLAILSN
jgi:hypothetical protein